MTQYRNHIPDRAAYMESYLHTLYQTKAIVVEFRTSKATTAEENRQDQEFRRLVAI